MTKGGGLANQLLGRLVKRNDELPYNGDGKGHGAEYGKCWPFNEPNRGGEHIATVEAAWVEDGSVKILARTPQGTCKELWLSHVKLLDDKR